MTGEHIKISGQIDLSKANGDSKGRLYLAEQRVVISSRGHTRTRHDWEHYIDQVP